MLEERRNLLNNMSQKETRTSSKRSYVERAKETAVHIERIRDMLVTREPAENSDDLSGAEQH